MTFLWEVCVYRVLSEMKRIILATFWFCFGVNGLAQNPDPETAIFPLRLRFGEGIGHLLILSKEKVLSWQCKKGRGRRRGYSKVSCRYKWYIVSNCKILKTVRRDIDAEAIRIFLFSKWIPKMIGERKVDAYRRTPVYLAYSSICR